VNTAAAQTGDGRDFSERPPCTVRSHDRVEALTCGFIELCDSPVESRRQLAFMPDTWSECFTRFHALRIVIYAGGVQQPGHGNPTFSFMTTGRSTMCLFHRVSGIFDRDLWPGDGRVCLAFPIRDFSKHSCTFPAYTRLCTKSPVRNLTRRSIGTLWSHSGCLSRSESSILVIKSTAREHFWCKAAYTL
jgi:hypothetical protein